MKVAIVHDYLNQYGGAERVVEVFHEIFPDAPIFTSIYLPQKMPDSFKRMDIRTSFMQKLPFLSNHFKKYLPLYPLAFESLNVDGYDILLSSSSAFAKGVKKGKKSCHICYCYTPMRFAWRYDDYIENEGFNKATRFILPYFINKLKKWDINTNNNVDHFIAISEYIAKRIKSIYKRDSEVIYPPVDTNKFIPEKNIDDYYLVVSRLNPYKKIDIIIKAFNILGKPLKIIGEGPYKDQLIALAGKNIEFLGKIPDAQLAHYYAKCKALVFPGEEDFGIVPVEVQAAGRPVIAYKAGGALETVVDNKTGVFFDEQDEASLIEAIKKVEDTQFDSDIIRRNALKYDKELFKEQIKLFIMQKYKESLG